MNDWEIQERNRDHGARFCVEASACSFTSAWGAQKGQVRRRPSVPEAARAVAEAAAQQVDAKAAAGEQRPVT